jgi:hypothetical protein
MPKFLVRIMQHDPTFCTTCCNLTDQCEHTKVLTELIFSLVSNVDGRPELWSSSLG